MYEQKHDYNMLKAFIRSLICEMKKSGVDKIHVKNVVKIERNQTQMVIEPVRKLNKQEEAHQYLVNEDAKGIKTKKKVTQDKTPNPSTVIDPFKFRDEEL